MSNAYFERRNREIEEKILQSEEKIRNQENTWDAIDTYEEYVRTKKVFKVQFESCGRDGTFVGVVDNNILVIMQGTSTLEHLPYFIPQIRSKLMGYEFEVKAIQVDREKRRVYVESARSAERAVQNASKTELVGNLIQALNRDEHPRVWGRVKSVQGQKAYVDIFGESVTGVIHTAYWQKSYLRYLSTVCKEGEFYPFDVVGMFQREQGRAPMFILNRENIADDPWKNVPMDILKKDALIYVKCIEKPEGGKNWWGNSQLTPYIEILGLYPRRNGTGQALQIIPGLTYKCRICRITHADEDMKGQNSFVVLPFAVVEADRPEYLRMLQMEQTRVFMEERKLDEQGVRSEQEDDTEEPVDGVGDGDGAISELH